MIELLLRSDLAVEFTEFKIVLPRAAVFTRWVSRPVLVLAGTNVRYWHKADIEELPANVRFWGRSGHCLTLPHVR